MECYVCGRTDSECRIRKLRGKELCPRHVTQMYRYGRFDDNTIYAPNVIELFNDHAEIILKNKKCEEVGRALIDLDDVEKCRPYKWHLRKGSGKALYAMASLPENEKVHLHRLVLNYDGDLDIDHINMNGLDNRKQNLRIVDHATNAANNRATGVKQVPSGNYQASVCRNYRTIYIGTYNTFEEAALARKCFIQENNL